MTTFIQLNLKRISSTLSLTKQLTRELTADVLVISKPPGVQADDDSWVTALDGSGAVAQTDSARLAPTGTIVSWTQPR